MDENQLNAMKMKIKRWGLLVLCASLVAACSTAPRSPAPVVERTFGAKVAGPGYYMVRKGDTLNQIARQHGQQPRDLITWNNLSNPNAIKVGQLLRVQRDAPAANGTAGGAQTAGVMPSGIEVKPLGAPSSSTPVTNKTTPRGEKQPYSDNALAAMSKPAVAAVPVAAGATATTDTSKDDVVKQPTVSDTKLAAKEVKGVVWMWPTDGKILATYNAKNKGIDIGGKSGQKVLAAADGRVMFASNKIKGYGNLVIVMHSGEFQSVYAHNSTILVKEGQQVSRGQPIATMGNTDSSVVKLHFEVRRQSKALDPAQFLPAG